MAIVVNILSGKCSVPKWLIKHKPLPFFLIFLIYLFFDKAHSNERRNMQIRINPWYHRSDTVNRPKIEEFLESREQLGTNHDKPNIADKKERISENI